ncbi:hypothetical protein DXG03_004588 [Asterophora parasitica]|uniref:Peptidase A1 domain-containing protein n=1 Tax=Asterophora parasitica TaxID=117018 RepID=A0A9P7GFE0_9AGAR|nr:hypothetical protein DXG03_004588 [Asterophora parasitica]
MSRFVINAIPFETRIIHDAKQILARDRERAEKLFTGVHAHGPNAFHSKKKKVRNNANATAARSLVDATDAGSIAYTVPVNVGQPPKTFSLLLDIGSSNIWVGADKDYRPSSTSVNHEKTIVGPFRISGDVIGTEYTDQVTLGGNLVVKNQTIGIATSARGFSGVDGILGIGPVDLTSGSTSKTAVAPVTQNLFESGILPTVATGMSYIPSSSAIANGEITFGAADTAKFTGSIDYVPITKISPADQYWGVDQDLSYGDSVQLLMSSAGIVDSGTTLLLLASDAFRSYCRATGAEEDEATGLFTVTEDQFASMESLFFTIGSETYEFAPNAQIWPRKLNDTIGGEEDKIYLIVADMGRPSGDGLDFINGFVFLQRFYTVFDTTNSRVGLARTKYTNVEIN